MSSSSRRKRVSLVKMLTVTSVILMHGPPVTNKVARLVSSLAYEKFSEHLITAAGLAKGVRQTTCWPGQGFLNEISQSVRAVGSTSAPMTTEDSF